VAIDEAEDQVSSVKVRPTRRQVDQLLCWAEPFEKRTWAVGVGRWTGLSVGSTTGVPRRGCARRAGHLGLSHPSARHGALQQERPNDALSVAIAAFRAPNLRSVEVADHSEVLRLLAKRNGDLGSHRARVACRLHALLAELAPGGIAKELYVSDAERLLAKITPGTPAEQLCYDLALELVDDVRRLDAQAKESHRRIRVAVKASGTSVTELYGVGPIIAAQLIGYAADIRRFPSRNAFASYSGTASIELSSGGRVVHRLSLRGNRQLNHAIHMATISQIRQSHSESRAYCERKVAEGKTKGRRSVLSSAW
jgi:transposase